MKCLVINLDRSPDRLAHISAEFARIGVAFQRVAAVDARSHPELGQQPQHPIYASRRLLGSEVACLHSHRVCWTMLAQDEARYGAIFEDDVVFSAKAGPLLADDGWIPPDADIVKLETYFKKTLIHRRRIATGHGFSAFRLYKNHPGTGGYIISRQAARDLLEATETINITADDLLFTPAFGVSSSKTIYQLVPALCVQDQFVSDRLPSLLGEERDAARTGNELVAKRRRPAAERIMSEGGRTVRWVLGFCRGRRHIVVPFETTGKPTNLA
ncbi:MULTISPECIES: glycosyltransferase family 25 protein [unclassified Mesorhizobium]|uniref:glycosyltransferase family 25 protein n=1 Tax=unclassified Mesorhizobium TaxID=325217 RepID=UPI00112D374D|nr:MULTISPECIES: glycosyltransferase family 25 protein [unclassified Mesorhizobium]TPL75658.1 glycosyltransferase family 25 protein [Mesorhizobium sp. B2-3-15]TPL98633.1 glycosyltransferase family 25 protein [Mesorhizobium sp. B2-3-10]